VAAVLAAEVERTLAKCGLGDVAARLAAAQDAGRPPAGEPGLGLEAVAAAMRTFFARLSDPAVLPELPKLQARSGCSTSVAALCARLLCVLCAGVGMCFRGRCESQPPLAPPCRCRGSRRRPSSACRRRSQTLTPRVGFGGLGCMGDVVGKPFGV
jgi:hypothetical protein